MYVTALCSFHHTLYVENKIGLFTKGVVYKVSMAKKGKGVSGGNGQDVKTKICLLSQQTHPPSIPGLPPELEKALKAAFAASNSGGDNPAAKANRPAGQNRKSPKKEREIINCEGLDSSYVSAVLRLYDALILDNEVRQNRTVDVALIINEGFPAFEVKIGKRKFKMIKQYFGLESKPADKPGLSDEEAKNLLARLRTYKCACYYIYGFKAIVASLAKCHDDFKPLKRLSEENKELTAAKLTLLAGVLCGEHYLLRHFEIEVPKENMGRSKKYYDEPAKARLPELRPVYEKISRKNDDTPYGPEELIRLWDMKFSHYGERFIATERLMYEVFRLEERGILGEVLQFCELGMYKQGKRWNFYSKDVPNPYTTAEKVKALKKKVNPVLTTISAEVSFVRPMFSQMYVEYLLIIHMCLKDLLKDGKRIEEQLSPVETTYVMARNGSMQIKAYRIGPNFLVSSTEEAMRWASLAEYVCVNDIELPFAHCLQKAPAGQVLGAIYLAQKLECQKAFWLNGAMEIAKEILAMDTNGVLKRELMAKKAASPEQLKEELGITDAHLKKWGAKDSAAESIKVANDSITSAGNSEVADETVVSEPITTVAEPARLENKPVDWNNPEECVEWIASWAVKNGYLSALRNDDSKQFNLIYEVMVKGNEEIISSFAMNKIDESEFLANIGFEVDIAPMYFDQFRVEPKRLVDHCWGLQMKIRQKKNAPCDSTIKLYHYLITSGIECGAAKQPMSPSKMLKDLKIK